MREYGTQVKKVYDAPKNIEISIAVSSLLREFKALGLTPEDWHEVYFTLLRKLTELNERYKLLSVVYRTVSLRSDYTTAGKVVYKVLKNFDTLFEKLPGCPSYFIPTPVGMWLFEQLINPSKREEVRSDAGVQRTIVQQLSLMSCLSKFKGVRT